MPDSVLELLARELAPVMEQQKGRQFATVFKHDAPSGTPSGVQYSHGPGGNLTWPGVDPQVWSAMMGADSLLSQLPTMPSLYTNPTYVTLTGVTDESGNEMDGVCDDAPIAGLVKACMTTSVFGKYDRATPLLDITRLGQRTDRADPVDLRLMNSPIGRGGPFAGLNAIDPAPADLLTNEIERKFWERNITFQRLLSRQLWIGNPADNSAGGGYKEMTGLSILVNTGYVDAETNQLCPSMDSFVRSFGSAAVHDNSDNTVAALTNMYHQLKERARRSGVGPVRWVLAMSSGLFYELTAIWPCSYLSFRCASVLDGNGAMRGNIDAQDAVRFRDEMRAGRYLIMDGERVEVITDDGIPETDGNEGATPRGCFTSDIYFLPMSVGGTATLFLEYFQYSNPSINDALQGMVLGRIDGAFLTWPRQRNMCVSWQSEIQPRLVLRTPWLAARLSNVKYCPIDHEPQPYPDDPYHTNGGVTTRSGPSYHTLWGA